MNVLKHFDVVAVLIAAIPALLLGAPALGYAIGGGAWILQRLIAAGERRFLVRVDDPRRYLGARLFASFGRIWLLAGAIVAAGVIGGRADGLTAAIVIFAAYSIAFAIRIASGPPEARAS
jgi:thiamine pyrophosphokinase